MQDFLKRFYRQPPNEMIKNGKFGNKFYKIVGNNCFAFKTKQEFEEAENKKLDEPKNYRKLNKLEDLINYYSFSNYRELGTLIKFTFFWGVY